MIRITNLTKKYADKIAVNNISFQVQPGVVTGFLGPNGAGKSTTIKMILNLVIPSAGKVTVDEKVYSMLESPLRKIGAMVDANTIDRRLNPKQYLHILASTSGLEKEKVEEVLTLVGLKEVENKIIGEFSFGMRQRVALAAALIGDPETIILDEPFNGLDVDGIHWLRKILRDLAKRGKAVLISSHLLSEVQEIAERIVLLAQGELIADMNMAELQEESLSSYVQVRTDNTPKLYEVLKSEGVSVEMTQENLLRVRKMSPKLIGDRAFEQGLRIYELATHQPSLEELFAELVEGRTQYRGTNLSDGKKESVQ
ncbi:MAG: ABC transporter ATP-binding protein [Peptostreptococcaceae bacterium]|nr:ABC transporter ATP-binding protein [Peptostreptococcaceae bacterium]